MSVKAAYAAVVGGVERVCTKVGGLNGGPDSDREWLLVNSNKGTPLVGDVVQPEAEVAGDALRRDSTIAAITIANVSTPGTLANANIVKCCN